MYLVLSEEQQLLQSTAREFVAARSSLRRIRALRDAADPDGFSRELWAEIAKLGWLGIVLPVEHDGLGLGWMELLLVMEEMGRGLMPEPMLSTVALGATAILAGGSDAQRAAHLPAVARGERLLALAHQEPASRHDRHRVDTRAVPAAGAWRIAGEKSQVLDGHVADHLIVSARTAGRPDEAAGITLFLVPAGAAGLTVERQARLDARGAALVRLDGVTVGADAVLGAVDGGAAVLDRTLDRATAAVAAEMLGGMEAAFEMTVEYLKTRQQFGVPIGSFQALKHRAAKLFVELELARSAVLAAGRAIDEGADDDTVARAASIAKARCSDTFMLIGHEGIQMHGGIGMTDEHDIGFFLKRARAAEMTFGDASYHRDRLATLAGY
jgi:alkylation response protein AidB-like acyl-CoA dehydrogenase